MAKLDLSNLKKTLQDAVDKKNADKANEDQIRQQKNQEDRNTMLESMSKDFGSVFKPYLDKIQEHSKLSSEELSRIIAQSVQVSVPDVNTEKLSTAIEAAITKSMGAIRIPTPNHTVNVPPIRIPPISMPEQMDIKGWIGVMGYDKGLLQNPLPVQIRDAQGNPVDLRQQAIQMMAGGGGKMDFFTINGITNTVGVVQINPDGSPFYSSSAAGGGSTSVGLLNSDGQTIDPRDRNWALTETLNVLQLSGAVNSVNVVGPIAQGDAATALRVVIAGNSDASVSATQVGTWNITTLTSITNSVAASLVDSSGVGYSGSNPLPVVFGASATQGVNIVDSSGIGYSGSNPVPTAVTGITNSVAVVALDRDGNPLTTGPVDNGDSATALRVVIAGNSAASVSATQVGTWNITTLTGITNSVAASLVDSSGVQYSGSNPLPVVFGASATQGVNVVDSSGIAYSGSNPVPTAVTGITNSVAVVALDRDGNPLTTGPLDNGDSATALRVVIAGNSAASVSATQVGTWNITTLTGITNSVAAAIVDSGGVAYSGSNPVPVALISGALTSTVTVGDSAARAGDNGGNPVKVGGIARQTNPTAFADGDRSNFTSDDLGRQVMRPVQVRDLTTTAFVSVTNGTETTLLAAGGAGVFLDLIFIKLTNNSSVAVGVDIRDVTAGGVIDHYEIPANGSVGGALPVPYPQGNANNNWTVDLPDITGTTVTVMGLFSKEV